MSRERYYERAAFGGHAADSYARLAERLVYKEACKDWNEERRKQLSAVIDKVEARHD